MLKFKLDSLDDVAEPLRELYTEKAGAFYLAVTGVEEHPDVAKLKDKNFQVIGEKKKIQDALKALQTQLEALEAQQGETEIKASEEAQNYQKALELAQKKAAAELEKLQNQSTGYRRQAEQLKVQSVIDQLAVALSGENADLIKPHVAARIKAVERDGQIDYAILDAEGNEAALSLDELRSEIQANKRYAPILAGRESSGSGANGASRQPAADEWEQVFKDGSNMTKRIELKLENPERYAELSERYPLKDLSQPAR